MRFLSLAAIVALAVAVVGCSPINVKYDFDTSADFAVYKTFSWIEQPIKPVSDVRTAQRLNTLLDKWIRTAVDAQLAAKGMTLVTENPDVLLVYHTGVDQKIDVEDWGYSYPRYPYGGWYGGQVDVYEYQEGTLIVDVIDAKSHQLVWRGTATKTIDEDATSQERQANLNEVVRRMFADYPPKK